MVGVQFVPIEANETVRLTEGEYGTSRIREDADNRRNQGTSTAGRMAEADTGEARARVNGRRMVCEFGDQPNNVLL